MPRRIRAKAPPHIPQPEQARSFSIKNFLFHPHYKTHRIAVVAHLIIAAIAAPFIINELSRPYAPAKAVQVTTTTYASIDTQIYAGSATTNYGTQTTMVAQGWSTSFSKRVLVKFDLSYIPAGATINSATLKLFQTGSYFSPSAQSVHRLTRSWTTGGVTWNKYDGTSNWTTAGGDYNSTATDSGSKSGAANGTEVDFTVTTDVASFAAGTYTNYGWVVKMTTESGGQNYMTYHSLESATTGYRPQLTVVYTEATAGPTVTANSASQKTDGSRAVDISTTISDSGNVNSKMAVYYVSQTGGSCGDDEVYITKATIDTTAANVSASVTPNPDVSNSNAYQIGTVTPIKTTAANTVQFDWLSYTDVPNVVGSYCLAFMGNNGTADSATTSISVTLDNLSLSWSDSWNQNINVGSVDGTWRGEAASDESGRSLALLGDINNDGYNDFAIGAPYNDDAYSDAGQVYIIFGTSTAFSQDVSLSSAGASYYGSWSNEYAGWDVAGVGDVNNDGYDDFVIGAKLAFGVSNAGAGGRAYLILGKASGWAMNTSLSAADASYYGEAASDNAGSAVAAAGDVNNDGYDDFLIGAPGNGDGGANAGQVYLIFGKASNWTTGVSLASADASFKGEGASAYAGLRGAVSGLGDVNGDGYDDIGVGEPYYGTGRAYVFFGKASGWTMDTAMSGADAGYVGETASDSAGFTVAPTGDVNNDGYDDFLIGAIGKDDGNTDAGQVYVIRGKASSWSTAVNLSGSNGSFVGEGNTDQLGYSASKPLFDGTNFNSDLNGDGYDDIILSAPYNQERSSTSDHGQVYVFFGTSTAFSMDTSVSTASSSFWGEAASDYLGWSVAVGDVNNDGGADILMSSMQNDDAASSAGQSYLVLSPGSINAAASVSVNSASQKNDSSGTVDISVSVGDAEANSSKLRVLYALRTGDTCGDETFSTKATLDETAGNVSASVTPKPDVENDNTYQVGTVTPILTSATNTVQFDWSAKTDVTTGNAAYCLAFIPNDGIRDGTTVYQSVTIDNIPPTSPGALTINTTSTQSVTFNLGSQSSDTNFLEYKIHYRTGSSGVLSSDSALTSSTVSGLGSSSYGGATTAQLSGLATSTQYVARIFVYDSYGNNASSTSEISFYTLATAPGTPTVSVSTTATSSLTLVVDPATNPSTVTYSICSTSDGTTCASNGYVQANGSLGSSAVWQTYATWGGSSGLSITGLSSNTSYRFLVKARNGGYVETAFSTASTAVATLAGPVIGPTVTNASTSSTLQLTLSWTNADQTGLLIERDNSCDGTYDLTIYSNTGANETSPTTTATNISANTCYAFRFSSYNSSGTVNSTHRATTAQITTPPGQPQTVASSAADETSITWGWDAVTGATSYNIYNYITSGLIGTATAPAVTYSQTGLSSNTQYQIIVRAVSSNGTGISSSNASTYTDATAPTGLSHTNQTTSAIRWTWTNSGQTEFYARNKNSTGYNSDWTTNAYWDYTGLTANTAYTMEVKGRNAIGEVTSYSEITRYTSQNAPSSLSFSSTTASSITVDADGTFTNQGVGSSLIHFDNGAGTTQDVTSGASWTNTGLNPNTQYTYTAYATNGDGDQTSSATNSKYTQANTPGTIATAVASASSLTLTLDRNSNPVSTNALIYETGTGTYVDTAGRTLTGDSSDFDTFTNWGTVTVTGLTPNTSYRFLSVAKNGDNVLSASSTASTAVYTLANAPSTPDITVVSATSLSVGINNNSNPASTEYSILRPSTGLYVAADLTLSASSPVWQTTSTWAGATITGLTPNTAYQFAVAARNGSQVMTASTTASSTYTYAAVPTTPTLYVDSDSQITATWTANNNPSGTEYYVDNVTLGTNSGWITQLSWASTGMSCGGTYSFRVKARNASGVETSNTDSVTAQTSSCRSGGGKRNIIQTKSPADVFKNISVLINGGAATTSLQNAVLTLNGGSSPSRMMIAEHPFFSGVGQEAYQSTKQFVLSPGVGDKTVYAKFYSTSGVESDTVSDSITVVPKEVVVLPPTAIVPPVVQLPADNQIFTSLPFVVSGSGDPDRSVVVKIAGTEYKVPITASSTQFSVTVLDQLAPGEYTVEVWQVTSDGIASEHVLRHIVYKLPEKKVEESVEEQVETPEEIVIEPKKPEEVEEPVVNEPVPTKPVETAPEEPPKKEEPLPVAVEESPTVEQVKELVSEVSREREAFLLVMRDHTAGFNKQQVNGIEAVQGESLKVLIRPPEHVRSITARLYNSDNNPSVLGVNNSKKLSVWKKIKMLVFGQPVLAEGGVVPDWIAGYVFAPKPEMTAYEQDIVVPNNVPAGQYKLVITMNGENGSRTQMSKVINAIPEGSVTSSRSSSLGNIRISVYRQAENGEFELWKGGVFGEENPRVISSGDAYSVQVPAGQYYLVVDAPLHDIYQSGVIVMKEPGIINQDIVLQSHSPDLWYRFVSWIVNLFKR